MEFAGIDVQKGQTQRSYVRNVDLIFDSASGVADLGTTSRIQIKRFDLDGLNPVSLSVPTPRISGNKLEFDFGVEGIGGNRNSNAGDGYYEIALDMDGDGSFESKKYFHRLLGDVTGDGSVDSADKARVLAFKENLIPKLTSMVTLVARSTSPI